MIFDLGTKERRGRLRQEIPNRAGILAGVDDAQQANFGGTDIEEYLIRKALQDAPTHGVMVDGKSLGRFLNGGDVMFHLVQEFMTQSGALQFIPSSRTVQFRIGQSCDLNGGNHLAALICRRASSQGII